MELEEAIQSYDGPVAGLRKAASAFDPEEAAVLYSYLESEAVLHRVAASWIIKAVLEQGGVLDGGRVFARLEREATWEVVLHLLQSVQHDPEGAAPWRARIETHRDHPKTLVAVWALDASVRIALAVQEGLAEARLRVDAALSAPKASMRARARQLSALPGL